VSLTGSHSPRSLTLSAFTIFQYFLRVVPTTYIDASRRRLSTSQYAVTDYSRSFEHGRGIPGIFFKYDLEAISLTIRERTTSLYQFLVRLVGVIGAYSRASGALSQANIIQVEYGQSLRLDCEYSIERRKRSQRPQRTTSSTSHRLCPAVVPPSSQVEMVGRGTLQEAIPEVAAGWARGQIRAMAWASGSIDDPALSMHLAV
jgi:hypothetical protein